MGKVQGWMNGSKYLIGIVTLILAGLMYFVGRNDKAHAKFEDTINDHSLKIQANTKDVESIDEKLDIIIERLP